MKRSKIVNTFLSSIILCLILFNINPAVYAQPKPSFSVAYETYPYSKLANPSTELFNGQKNFEQDLEIRVATLFVDASYPFIFSEGKTVLVNQVEFQRFDLDYKKWNEEQGGTNRIEHAFSVVYSLTLVRQLARNWSLMAVLAPGAASDFRDDVDKNDFSIQAAAIFIKQFSQSFSMGYGLAYSTAFGQAFPFPIIAMDWNNGSNLKFESILPVSAELSYCQLKT